MAPKACYRLEWENCMLVVVCNISDMKIYHWQLRCTNITRLGEYSGHPNKYIFHFIPRQQLKLQNFKKKKKGKDTGVAMGIIDIMDKGKNCQSFLSPYHKWGIIEKTSSVNPPSPCRTNYYYPDILKLRQVSLQEPLRNAIRTTYHTLKLY